MLPDPLQAHSRLPIRPREGCSNQFSLNLLGLQVLPILQPPLHPPDGRLLARIPGRRRYLGANCLRCRDRGHVLDLSLPAAESSDNYYFFHSCLFSPFPYTLNHPLSCVCHCYQERQTSGHWHGRSQVVFTPYRGGPLKKGLFH